jgi:ribonuclease P protein component
MVAPDGPLQTLKRRSEFLRIRNGLRWATASFVLEAKVREGWSAPVPIPTSAVRFGLTVTKQLGSAVRRNRIRRRLKAALQECAPTHAKPGFDYVVIARAPAETSPFETLVGDLVAAFAGVHSPRGQYKPPRQRAAKQNSSRA